MTHLNRIALMTLLMAVSVTTVFAVSTKIQRDPKFDFSKLKTWSWNPSGPGDVKVILTADSKSEPVKRQYEPALMQAVEEQLSARGYTRAPAAPADFVVTYYVFVTAGTSSSYAGQDLPSNANYGIPPFAPQTTNVSMYPKGTLVLDVASPTPTTPVWRGIAEAKIEEAKTDAERETRLRGIIKDLVSKFPKRTGS